MIVTNASVMVVDEFVPTETSYIVIRYNRNATQTKYREGLPGTSTRVHVVCTLLRRHSQKRAPSTQKKKTALTGGESENAKSFPRGQPPKRTQNTWLKTARFQKGQNRTHLTSEFGETVSGVFRTGNPIHILKFPVLQGLLNAQKMTN